MGKKTRRHYTPEFKEQAVALAAELKSISKAEAELGIPHGLIHQWRRKIGAPANSVEKSESAEDEIRRLRQENEKLKKVNQILKSAAAFFSQDHLK
jgi:transposase